MVAGAGYYHYLPFQELLVLADHFTSDIIQPAKTLLSQLKQALTQDNPPALTETA